MGLLTRWALCCDGADVGNEEMGEEVRMEVARVLKEGREEEQASLHLVMEEGKASEETKESHQGDLRELSKWGSLTIRDDTNRLGALAVPTTY